MIPAGPSRRLFGDAGERDAGLPYLIAIVALVLVGTIAMAIFVGVPLHSRSQALLGAATILLFVILSRSPKPAITLFLAILSVMITARYLFWRIADTIDFKTFLQGFLGVGLLAAEIYAFVVLVLGYGQTVWRLERKPVSLPVDDDIWPHVDVFIPTYSEDLSVVRPTVLAALSMDWPRDRLHVFILDDGARSDFRAFAMACDAGYISRQDNRFAKAGNLNNALDHTTSEYVAVFDCDHVPTNAFLQLTMGWMVRDPTLAFVQTPHHFYAPDPVQRNLVVGANVPAEGNVFYGMVQDGNDLWNAAFFCGSCAVLRRTALQQIGGFGVETVTEDAHTALRLHRAGWSSAYLRLPLAAGLGTDRLIDYVGQRLRWARGMIQIFRSHNPLFGPGLNLSQRLCYFNAVAHFLFALPRVVLLTAPLAYLLLGQSIFVASPFAMLAYSIPHLFHATATNARIHQNWRHSVWSEVYETLIAFFLVPVTIATLIAPSRAKFNVTRKNGGSERSYFDVRAVYPNLIVGLLLVIGLARGLVIAIADIPLWLANTGLLRTRYLLELQAVTLNMFWAGFSLVVIMAAVAVGRETRQVGNRTPIAANLAVRALLTDGRAYPARSRTLSLEGAEIVMDPGLILRAGSHLDLEFNNDGARVSIPARIVGEQAGVARMAWRLRGAADEQRLVQVLFGRADAWLSWSAYRPDRPLASLREVLAGIGGLFRRERATPNTEFSREPPDLPIGARTEPRAGRIVAGIALLLLLAAPAGAQTPVSGGTIAAPPTPPASATQPASPIPNQPADVRQVVWTLRDLGAATPMTMRGDPSLQGVLFGILDDEVVVGATLTLSGAISPALIPELTNITVTLNEQYVGTIGLDPKHPQFDHIELPINPVFFDQHNRLNFRFTGRYARDCNDPLSPLIWSEISNTSSLTLTLARLPAQHDLARLPLPFFDANSFGALKLPFVISPLAADGTVKAAGTLASWFGKLLAYRGASFPVDAQPPVQGNAVVVVSGADSPPGLALPPINGPTLAEIANPNDPHGTILLVAGRNPAETDDAARMLVLGAPTLSGSARLVSAPAESGRRPYDAPGWIPTDHPVPFGQLVETSTLQGVGYFPPVMHVPFHTAPDFVTWRGHPFTSTILFRAPPGPILDVAVSHLDVKFNDQVLGSYSMAPSNGAAQWWQELMGEPPVFRRVVSEIPTYAVGGSNDLQMYFDARPLDRGKCVMVPQDLHIGADPNSTIDLTSGYHFAVLPNLAWFAGSGFPFSRMADLSDTAVILPDRPTPVEFAAFLDLMGHIGAQTLYPVTDVSVVRPAGLPGVHDKHLLMLGTMAQLAGAAEVLSSSPYTIGADGLAVKLSTPLAAIWRLFGDDTSEQRRRAAADLSAPLDQASAAMVGAQSPYRSDRSVVAILSGSPAGVLAMVEALGNPRITPDIRGDLVLLQDHRASSYRGGPTYSMGTLPIWLRIQTALDGVPLLVLLAGLLAAAALAMVLSWVLPAQRRRRLGPQAERTGPQA